MDQWGALTTATSAFTRDDLSIRRKTVIVSKPKIKPSFFLNIHNRFGHHHYCK